MEATGLINEVLNKRLTSEIVFPQTWVLTPTNRIGYDCENLSQKSKEYNEVLLDFMTKSKNKFRCLKVINIVSIFESVVFLF